MPATPLFLWDPGEERGCSVCGELLPPSEFYEDSTACKPCVKARAREAKARTRAQVIARLGGACACCGETEYAFLEVDHVNDDGAEHRKELAARRAERAAEREFALSAERRARLSFNRVMGMGKAIYAEFLRGDCAYELQVLCANCHAAKSRTGSCPHELRRPVAHDFLVLVDPGRSGSS